MKIIDTITAKVPEIVDKLQMALTIAGKTNDNLKWKRSIHNLKNDPELLESVLKNLQKTKKHTINALSVIENLIKEIENEKKQGQRSSLHI